MALSYDEDDTRSGQLWPRIHRSTSGPRRGDPFCRLLGVYAGQLKPIDINKRLTVHQPYELANARA